MTTPDCHREMWSDACGENRYCAWAAPRGHAKTTSITHTLTLVVMLFRIRDYGLIASDTEGQAMQFLLDIKIELLENDDLRRDFQIRDVVRDTAGEIIVEFLDGSQFCIVVKGSEQKVRGLKWRNKRPNFIVGDDLENDEIVLNPERRTKFKNWFFNALLPCGSKDCVYRIVGTILHFDSLLENLLNDPEWGSRRYSAHHSFDDFSGILWPDRWTEEELKKVRQKFINNGKEDGYSQEYLNQPISNKTSYFNRESFRDLNAKDADSTMTYYAAVDFAISEKQTADRTVIVIAGLISDNTIIVKEVRKGRWDSKEIVDQMLSVQEEFHPEKFILEAGAIQKSIGPFLDEEMVKKNIYLDLEKIVPSKDKKFRAQSIQARIRAGGVRFDKESDWWPDLEQELIQFPRGKHDDQVDALAYIGLYLASLIRPLSEEEEDEEEWRREERSSYNTTNKVTGY